MGALGEVEEDLATPAGGTSSATPVISGLSLLLKQSFLARGMSFINNPGRLHTAMLAMGDRHFSESPANPLVASTQRVTGGHRNFGFGRAKLRLIGPSRPGGPWGDHFQTRTFTAGSNTTQSYFAFNGALLPFGVDLVKCVLFQAEDMSGSKADISGLELRIDVRSPVNFVCSPSGIPSIPTRSDTSFDTKSMVAITSADTSLGSKCI